MALPWPVGRRVPLTSAMRRLLAVTAVVLSAWHPLALGRVLQRRCGGRTVSPLWRWGSEPRRLSDWHLVQSGLARVAHSASRQGLGCPALAGGKGLSSHSPVTSERSASGLGPAPPVGCLSSVEGPPGRAQTTAASAGCPPRVSALIGEEARADTAPGRQCRLSSCLSQTDRSAETAAPSSGPRGHRRGAGGARLPPDQTVFLVSTLASCAEEFFVSHFVGSA